MSALSGLSLQPNNPPSSYNADKILEQMETNIYGKDTMISLQDYTMRSHQGWVISVTRGRIMKPAKRGVTPPASLATWLTRERMSA